MNHTGGDLGLRAARRRDSVWALAFATLALPAAALAQETAPSPPVGPGQAESTADTLGTGDVGAPGDTPTTEGQAESNADALGGVDDEGALPLGQQPGAGVQQDLPGQDLQGQGLAGQGLEGQGFEGQGLEGQGFGDTGFLPLGQQPSVGGAPAGVEGQDLPDTELGARGVDVEGTLVEPGFADTNRAARGVEPAEPGDIEVPLEDVDLQSRGVRLQGEQVNESLLDARAEGSRGVEPAEGPRAGPQEVPARNVPGGGLLVIPGSGFIAPGPGGGASGGFQSLPAAPAGVSPAGEGVAAVGEGLAPAGSSELEGAEELEPLTVTGTVLAVSYSDAQAQIATNEQGTLAVRARPQEIALLQPGDFVALNVSEIGDSIWITPAARFEPASADVTAVPGAGAFSRDLSSPIFEQRGRTEGVVTGVNAEQGVFLVGDRAFLAHPAQVRGLAPGQFVSVSYGTVADEDWAADIRVGSSGS